MERILNTGDIKILRSLASEIRELADSSEMERRRKKWFLHNDRIRPVEPIILFETQGMLQELLPDADLGCTSPLGRQTERLLRARIYHARSIPDDRVLDDDFCIEWHIREDGWRSLAKEHRGTDSHGRDLGHVPIPFLEDPAQICEIKPAQWSVDREETVRELVFWENLLGDILSVRLRAPRWWTMGMTSDFIRLTGMENFFTLPYDDPDCFHAIMRFLLDEANREIDFLERENLLCLNNRNDYVGSGSCGFTERLNPCADGRVTSRDLWVLLESQESSCMSPQMFQEFIFPYQLELSKRFGLCYYGCCEPLENRMDILSQIPNLHTVSVSPWCDMEKISGRMRPGITAAVKPNPSLISSGFEEEILRQHTRTALSVFRGRPIEFVMKDIHTLQGDLTRIVRWLSLVREEIRRMWNE